MQAAVETTRLQQRGQKTLEILVLVISAAIPLASHGLVSALTILLLLVVYPAYLTTRRERFFRRLWLVTLLWAGAQLVSDIFHGTQMFSGMAAIGPLSALLAMTLFWLHETEKQRVDTLAVALSVGWLGLVLAVNHGLPADNPWKYGLAPPVTALVLAVIWRWRWSVFWTIAALAGLLAVSLSYDYRFYAGLTFMLACATLFLRRKPREHRSRRSRRIMALAAAGVAAYLLYPHAAAAGWLGARAQEQQMVYDLTGSNYLVAARPEMPQALYIFAQNPVLGIGSNAVLNSHTSAESIAFAASLGAPVDNNVRANLMGEDEQTQVVRGYATHSAALDTAVHAGFLALAFWAFLYLALFRGLTTRSRDPRQMLVLLFLGGLTVWDSLFSPLTATHYMQIGLLLFLLAAHAKEVCEDQQSGEVGPVATSGQSQSSGWRPAPRR